MSAMVYGPVAFELRPTSRLSKITTWNIWDSAGTCASVHSVASYPIPMTSTSGGPSPWTSKYSFCPFAWTVPDFDMGASHEANFASDHRMRDGRTAPGFSDSSRSTINA